MQACQLLRSGKEDAMTAQPGSTASRPFVDVLDDAHQQAVDALTADQPLDAVVWLSAHLAACQRTLHRAAGRVPAAGRALNALRVADAELERLLRNAEQHHAGDSLAAQLDATRLEAELRDALDRHAEAERILVAGVVDRISSEDADALMASYDEVLRQAPTRPHPHAPHRGLLGAAAFRVDALRDRVMDTMDGRNVPSPRRERQTTRPGRWGRYVLGEMQE
jgi:hypothetical protein